MKKRFCVRLCLLLVIPGLLFTVSCAKKEVRTPETTITETDEAARIAAQKAEEERRRAEASRLEEERLRDEAEKQWQQQAAERKKAAARQRFEFEDIHFSFDRSDLSETAQRLLREKAAWLWDNPSSRIVIEGHCDERGTTEYNLALGERRAVSAKRFLMDLGISSSRMTSVSYGEEKPLDSGHNEAAWAKNRRAHFVLR